MNIDNPWQVVSIEAFYCLKCPECMYFTTDDDGFYNHAVENHPLSGVLFGKPKDKTIDPEEILNFLVKNEPLEDSFENEDNETLSEKTFETFDQTNILERESFENLTTLNQAKITYDTKPENIESFTETGYRVPENSFEVKSDKGKKRLKCKFCNYTSAIKSNLKKHIKLLHEGHKNYLFEVKSESIMNSNQETEKSAIDVRPNENEGIKIMDSLKEHIEKLKNDKDKLSEFITTTNQILDKPDIERLGKKRKVECPSCLRILNKETFNKHVVNCELYQKLIKNETQCRVCDKKFATKLAINQHLGANHKEAVMQLQFDELGTMKKDSEKFEKNKDKQQLNWLAKNY